MRFPTTTFVIAATVATTVATGQPAVALTADEKREQSRLLDAERTTLFRKKAEVMNAYTDKCEAAFAAGEPMPERDIRITETIVIDDDLLEMTVEEISEQFGLASDATREARNAMNDCMRKFQKRNDGS